MTVGLFPGQGLDARAVAAALPDDDDRLRRANEILDLDLKRAVTRTRSTTLPTRLAQPAIFVAGVIAFENSSQRFDALVGHSLGEYTALAAGGALSFADGVKLVAARANAMAGAARMNAGGMAAVLGLEIAAVEDVAARAGATIANDNSATQLVIAGDETALRRAATLVRDRGGRCVRLSVEGPFHSPAMQPAVAALADALDRTMIHNPTTPVIANVSARPYRAPGEIRKLLVRQLTGRVRFRESIEWLLERGTTEFVDLGPGRVVDGIARTTIVQRRKETAHA